MIKLPHISPPKSGVKVFAVVCVAVIAGYVMWMGYNLNEVLSGPGWCRTALGAEKVSSTDGTIKGLDACVGLLTIQLRSLSTNSHILFGVVALCLLVLITVVIAQARLDLKLSTTGLETNMSDAAIPVKVVQPPSEPVPTTVEPKPGAPTSASDDPGPALPQD